MRHSLTASDRRTLLARLRQLSIPGLTFGAIGVLLLLLAAVWAVNSALFLSKAVRVPGIVVRNAVEATDRSSHERRSNRSGGPTYSPVVQFRGPDGRQVEFTGLGGSEAEYREGDSVFVLHPPAHPENARIDSHQELWLGPIVIGGFGLLLAGVGLLAVRLKF